MADQQDKFRDLKKIDRDRNVERRHHSSAGTITDDMNAQQEIKAMDSGEEISDELSRKAKINWHWLFLATSWTVWLAGFFLLAAFLWNYLAPDELTWLSSEKVSDLKFVIGVTSINVAGLYIQWLRSNKIN